MVESGGVEPHPLLQRNLVFKTSRRTISPASLSMSGGNGRTRTYDRIPYEGTALAAMLHYLNWRRWGFQTAHRDK